MTMNLPNSGDQSDAMVVSGSVSINLSCVKGEYIIIKMYLLVGVFLSMLSCSFLLTTNVEQYEVPCIVPLQSSQILKNRMKCPIMDSKPSSYGVFNEIPCKRRCLSALIIQSKGQCDLHWIVPLSPCHSDNRIKYPALNYAHLPLSVEV